MVLAWAAALLACAGEESPSPPAAAESPAADAGETVTPAVYRTSVTFVGFSPPPALVHLAFENRTGPGAVRLAYRGWLARGGGWQPVLALRDSLPLPRAAWRVLPSPGALAVRVGEGGEVRGIRIASPEGALRLEGGGALASWSGDGGHRESLRAGTLWLAGGPETGLLLTRQSARPAGDTASAGRGHAFVLADSAGNALLLLREGGPAEVSASAWTRLDGVGTEWVDAIVRPLSTPPGSTGRWAVQLPEAGILGELEGGPPALEETGPGATGLRVFRAVGTLVVGGAPRRMVGVGMEDSAGAATGSQ